MKERGKRRRKSEEGGSNGGGLEMTMGEGAGSGVSGSATPGSEGGEGRKDI